MWMAVMGTVLIGVACSRHETAPDAAATCGANDTAGPLPMEASGWVPASSNRYCIQGAWTWSSDAETGGKTTLTGTGNSMPPYSSGRGMCLEGSTPGGVADDYLTWGASIELNLNQVGPTHAPIALTAAPACFTITVTGNGAPGGLTGFLCPPNMGGSPVCPEVSLVPGPNEVCINDVALPSWCTPTLSTGQTCLPPSMLAQGVQSVGVEANSGSGGAIDFCISSIIPHDIPRDAGTPTDSGRDGSEDGRPSADAGLIGTRPYSLHVPVGYDPAVPAPLVVMLHGYSSSGPDAESSIFHLTPSSDAQGFLYALPDGTVDSAGNRFWNATDACCNFYGSTVDDVAYLNAVLDDIATKYAVDRTRVFFGGHSNGAMMAQVLACRSAKRIAAVFSYAGALWADTTLCQPDDTVSIIELHGDMDPTVPYDGGSNTAYPGSPPYPAATTTVETWASLDHCTGMLTDVGETIDLVPALPGSETAIAEATGCPAGVDAELWTIHGGSHQDALDASAFADRVWGFFQNHPKSIPDAGP